MRPARPPRPAAALAALAVLAGCGTSFTVEDLSDAELAQARSVAQQERAAARRAPRAAPDEAADRFIRVADSIEPVAEAFCRELHPDEPWAFCDFHIGVDPDLAAPPNAWQRLHDSGRPELGMTLSFIAEARNDDELAFVLGHEAGHQIAEHLVKRRQQQQVGAALMGIAMGAALGAANAYGGGYQTAWGQYQDQLAIQNAMIVGAAAGGAAYSQTYELEADMLGAYIAERAGYDPERGARVFARLAASDDHAPPPGAAAFWSTHPHSDERIAIVARTAADIARQREAGLHPMPEAKPDPAPPRAFTDR